MPELKNSDKGSEAAVEGSIPDVGRFDLEQAATPSKRAERINEAHRAGNAAAMDALEHYYRAGALLNEQKADLPHGGWIPWLEANFEGDPRTAQRYMRVADNWPAIKANTTRVSYLTLSKALESLTEPEEFKQNEEPTGFRALHECIVPAIKAAESLIKVRDQRLYRDKYATFEDYCWNRFKLDADGIRAVLEIADPESRVLRDAAIVVMCERNLTFKEALDYITNEFQQHLKGAA
jgi:hypothetical protein